MHLPDSHRVSLKKAVPTFLFFRCGGSAALRSTGEPKAAFGTSVLVQGAMESACLQVEDLRTLEVRTSSPEQIFFQNPILWSGASIHVAFDHDKVPVWQSFST